MEPRLARGPNTLERLKNDEQNKHLDWDPRLPSIPPPDLHPRHLTLAGGVTGHRLSLTLGSNMYMTPAGFRTHV